MNEARPSGSDPLTAEFKYRLLLRIAEKISGAFELDEVLEHLIETVRFVVSYDAAGIFVLNRPELPVRSSLKDSQIASMATRGFDSNPPESDPMLKYGRGIIGHVIERGQSVILPDVRQDPRYVVGRKRTLSEIAVPIFANDRVIGALNLESDRPGAFTQDDLEVLQFFANAAAISIERAIAHNQLVEKKRLESQLEIARDVQRSLLPSSPPLRAGYDIAGINLPAYEVGGDYYDYIEFPDGGLGVAIADVSGKGVPAALIMATCRAALRTQVRNDCELPRIMEAVNRLLCESIGSAAFVSAFYGVLDPATGWFSYTNSGHNPPLLVGSDGLIERLKRGGTVLGFLPECEHEAGVAALAPGDSLVLYTDGVIEVTDVAGREFGEELLEGVLRETQEMSAADTIQSVISTTQAHSGSQSYPDDFTILVIKRTSDATPDRTLPATACPGRGR